MKRSEWDEVCIYMEAVFGRGFSRLQREGGWSLMQNLSRDDVGDAIELMARQGRETMPSWSLVYKVSTDIAQGRASAVPELPASDSLTDEQHQHVMRQLRARQTPEQRRRADRMTGETKQLPMKRRIRMAGDLLMLRERDVDAGSWDRLFEQRLAQELEAVKV